MDSTRKQYEKSKLVEINSHLTCSLCKGYYIDATTISECLHSFCRSCIIKFLQDNSHCPVCEVIINKAKPNIKLDKTLQDIVYKLVPELFLNEMTRRQRFYHNYPELAARVTPEERGEDIERTIFNPKDTISLSVEYISDDSAPGAISVLSKNGTCNEDHNHDDATNIKRFLQCPGMCRVEVLKKFICNKYNVDAKQYYVEFLYKRVPLPDYYTLIDIAYIYSWKRNEPMKFFFKIIDAKLAVDQYEFIESETEEPIKKTPKPVKIDTEIIKTTRKVKTRGRRKAHKKIELKIDKNDDFLTESLNIKNKLKRAKDGDSLKAISKDISVVKQGATRKQKLLGSNPSITDSSPAKNETKAVDTKPQNAANNEYTSITLNRNTNVEIITKIQKVSNKNGQPIGLKITKQTVKKPVCYSIAKTVSQNQNKSASKDHTHMQPKQNSSSPAKTEPTPAHANLNVNRVPEIVPKFENDSCEPDIDTEKSNFLKSIELTAKSSAPTSPDEKIATPKATSGQKRKNPSPVKNEKASKRLKKSNSPSALQPKCISNPAVRQIVTNVNENVNNLSKIVEQTIPKISPNSELQSLFDNCKINIPSSLSITLKERTDGDGDIQTPSIIKPVQNYIEILKLPDMPLTPNPNETKMDTNKLHAQFGQRPKLSVFEQILQSKTTPLQIKTEPHHQNPDEQHKTQENHKPVISKSDIKLELNFPNFEDTAEAMLDLEIIKNEAGNNASKTSQECQMAPPLKNFVLLTGPMKANSSGLPYLRCKVTNLPTKDNFVKLNPRSPQTFQKMFEESLKKADFINKFQTVSAALKQEQEKANLNGKPIQKDALNLTTNDTVTGINKRNILEIASQLYKKTKLEHDKLHQAIDEQNSKENTNNDEETAKPEKLPESFEIKIPMLPSNAPPVGKVAIPRLPNQKILRPASAPQKTNAPKCYLNPKIPLNTHLPIPQTFASLRSPSLGMNYTVSVSQNPQTVSNLQKKTILEQNIPTPTSIPVNQAMSSFTTPPTKASNPKQNSLGLNFSRPNTPQNTSPTQNGTIVRTNGTSPLHLSLPPSPKTNAPSPVQNTPSPKPSTLSPIPSSPAQTIPSPKPNPSPPNPNSLTPRPNQSQSPKQIKPVTSQKRSTSQSPKIPQNNAISPGDQPLSPNQLLEKYNIQNLAQLTANFNFPPNFGILPSNQLAALHQAMILRHFEMQNRQNWINMNPTPMVQYEKYLQSLTQNHGPLLGKEN